MFFQQHMQHKQKWQLFAPVGLATIGFGLSLLGDTVERKSKGGRWFVRGTVSLSLINAGICIFGDAVKARALYELRAEH